MTERDQMLAFMKELSNALISVRPLGGSELFVKRFDDYFADPAYCKSAIKHDAEARHEAMLERVRAERNRDMWKGQCERQAAQLAQLRDLLAKSTGALMCVLHGNQVSEDRGIVFTGAFAHLGKMSFKQILDAADAGLSETLTADMPSSALCSNPHNTPEADHG
jgi:hypothetical protein